MNEALRIRADVKDTVKDRAEAASTQSKFANWLWLALIFISVVVLIPRPAGQPGAPVELPFDLGEVEPGVFHFVTFFMLSVLLVAFCQAHAQTVRAHRLARRAMGPVNPNDEVVPGMHPHDLFDALVTPSLSRVAALPQMVRGDYQFHPESASCPRLRRVLTTILYAYLKAIAVIVYLFLPAAAMGSSLWRFVTGQKAIPGWLAWLGFAYAAGAFVCLGLILCTEVKYALTVIRKIGSAHN